MNTSPSKDETLNQAAARLAEILVEAITEKYAKKRKKAKSPESPSELSQGS